MNMIDNINYKYYSKKKQNCGKLRDAIVIYIYSGTKTFMAISL